MVAALSALGIRGRSYAIQRAAWLLARGTLTILVALLAVLGVDLTVILAFLTAVLLRRRWVRRQAGAFKGAIRVVQGDVPGLSVKWRRGYGQWIRDILVWYRAPFAVSQRIHPRGFPGRAGPRG
ncbi:DUF2550 family protein [Streptomyces sp. NPDC047461]|uniref:DUF2550 family protein n=1 Tax=Streptomyces sp. NPDC047461 TaxID=3155619 RepID=UPI0033D1DF20